MKRLHNPWPFASIGLAAIGIGSAAPILLPDFFAETPIPAWAVPYVKLGAVMLIIFGSIGVLLAILTWCLRPLSDTATFLLLTRGRYGYFVAQAGIDDLDDLYVHYVDLFGHDIVPRPQMADWLKKNPRIVFRILRGDSRRPHDPPILIGFFDIEPLTSMGEAKLRRDDASTLRITHDDIKSPRSGLPRAYYVGSVGSPRACSEFQRGITMAFFLEAFRNLSSASRITVYARPATDSGLYLVTRLFAMTKLQELPDKQAVWVRDIPRNGFALPSHYARFAKYLQRRISP